MDRVLLDTSFLISFADPARPHHKIAFEWFEYCINQSIVMELSTIVIAEFEVRQSATDLPLDHFHILPFNFKHAQKAGVYRKVQINNAEQNGTEKPRATIVNDLKILAQAESESISFLLTEDQNTLAKFADMFRKQEMCRVRVLLLKEGFSPRKLQDPDQSEMEF